ncbi:MAG: hypothetical protein V2I66_00185 [Halieaceae bacterium]|jgi:hypothetical protein|nr:hypothetical protein [Halieaceae bacterium]
MKENKQMEMIEFYETPRPVSLKQQLVAAVAKGDELAAEEIRMLLKINEPEKWGKLKTKKA